MDSKLLWIIGGIGAYYLLKGRSSFSSPGASGLGVGGAPRAGRPKTEAERAATHAQRVGGELPPRGTGLKRQGLA